MTYKEYVPYTKNVEVTEHRAPTDEAIRLYKEMEEKAELNIISKERFIDNELNGVVTYIEMCSNSFDVKAHIKFSLNGKEYHNIVTVSRSYSIDRQKSMMLLYTSIIEELAKTFTIEIDKIKYQW
jgi:hypothetical protein